MATPPVSLFVNTSDVLEGSVADDTGVCTAGNYARRPPGCVHTVTSPTGALVIAITSGPTEPL